MDDRLFNMLTELFEVGYHSNIINYEQCDISDDEDHLYYTLVFKRELSKDDISIFTTDGQLELSIKILKEEPYIIDTVTPILPEKTIATLKNNILDIILVKDRIYRYKQGYKDYEVIIND